MFQQIGLSLLVSLVAGAIAGISGAIVSAPADLLLTKSAGAGAADGDGAGAGGSALAGGELDTSEASEGGMLDGVFAGVGVRCVFFAASIAVQVGAVQSHTRRGSFEWRLTNGGVGGSGVGGWGFGGVR